MSPLSKHLDDYLRLRRTLGFKLEFAGQVLPQFIAYMDVAGTATVTTELAIAWAALPCGVQRISLAHRLGAVRGFARYLRTVEPATEVPPCGIWPSATPRRVPHLWSESEIACLLEASRRLRPALRALTHETLFGLLAATGMRVGEALQLDTRDVNLAQGVLTIQNAKFDRSRLVPLHATTVGALRSYIEHREQLCPKPQSSRFLLSSVGTNVVSAGVHKTFVQLTSALGLRAGAARPRIHDLRHTFAVRTLIAWHRAGVEVDGRIALLSTYLGHVNPAGTYWYLSATPELMELAAARLDGPLGDSR